MSPCSDLCAVCCGAFAAVVWCVVCVQYNILKTYGARFAVYNRNGGLAHATTLEVETLLLSHPAITGSTASSGSAPESAVAAGNIAYLTVPLNTFYDDSSMTNVGHVYTNRLSVYGVSSNFQSVALSADFWIASEARATRMPATEV
jgi:hypothetical protein